MCDQNTTDHEILSSFFYEAAWVGSSIGLEMLVHLARRAFEGDQLALEDITGGYREVSALEAAFAL